MRGDAYDPYEQLLITVVMGAIFAWSAIRAHRDPTMRFSLLDMVTDSKTGRTSLRKVGQLAALCVSTWGFVYLTLAYRLSEAYFGLYMAAWAGANLAGKWIDRRS